MRTFVCLSALLLAACGGSLADEHTAPVVNDDRTPPTSSSSSSSSSGAVVTGPETVIAALSANSEISGGQTYQRFDMDFVASSSTPVESGCPDAAATAGSCCYYPPIRRPPTQPPGDSTAPAPARHDPSAGTVTLTDATSNASLRAFPYANGIYATAPASFASAVWQPGDLLRVTATGGDPVAAFTMSAPTLLSPVMPGVAAETPISLGKSFELTWTPDPNAETFEFTLLDGLTGAAVVCSAPDADGKLAIDGSLLGQLKPNIGDQAVGSRTATRYTQTATGRIAFTTSAWTSVFVPVQ